MALRDLGIAAAVGALGYVAWRLLQPGWTPLPLDGSGGGEGEPMVSPPAPSVGQDYFTKLAHAESGGNPLAKAPTSSASGLFQFVKSVALALGLPWGPNPSLPFGGAVVTPDQQLAAIARLTEQNVAGLQAAGIAVTDATLYAAHFLGLTAAIRVLTSPDTAKLITLLPVQVLTANPFLQGFTVADFKAWAARRIG